MEELKAVESLAALAHPTRLAVFRVLVTAGPGGIAAGDLARSADVPASTLSSHLARLEHAGLVSARRQSRHIFYAVQFEAARRLIAFLMEDCCAGHPEICAPRIACVETEGTLS